MIRFRTWIAPVAALAMVWAVIPGCAPTEPAAEAPEPKTEENAAATGEMPGDVFADDQAKVEEVSLTEEQIANIEQLPEAEQPIALAQKVCPISEEPLGSMGAPKKIELNGQPVFLCCGGCVKDAEENPDATLAKVAEAKGEPEGGSE